MISLGDKVEDIVTGFTGYVTGLVDYISGCNQALVVPRIGADGAARESQWFDRQRLTVLPGERLKLDNGNSPGSDKAAPKR